MHRSLFADPQRFHFATPASTICVTGGSGFAAGHIVEELLAAGHTVHATVRDAHTPGAQLLVDIAAALDAAPRLHVFTADLLHPETFRAAITGATVVVHTAAAVMLDQVVDPFRDMIDVGVNGTRGICALANELGVRRIVLTSSLNVVMQPEAQRHPHRRGTPFTEDEHRLDFRPTYHPYGAEKCLSERAALDTFHGEVVALQPGLILGPLLHNDVRSSMQMLRMLLLKEAPLVFPMNACVPVDVRDLAAAHHGACFVPLPSRCRFRRYNLAGPDNTRSTPMSVVANVLRELVPELATPVMSMPVSLLKFFALFDRRINAYMVQELVVSGPGCDTRRVEDEMGFRFRYQLRDTLRDAVLSFERVGLLALPAAATRRLVRDSAVVARGANAAAAAVAEVSASVAKALPETPLAVPIVSAPSPAPLRFADPDAVSTAAAVMDSHPTPLVAPVLSVLLPCDLAALRSVAACGASFALSTSSTWLSRSPQVSPQVSYAPMTPHVPGITPTLAACHPLCPSRQLQQPDQSTDSQVDPIALLVFESRASE